MFSVLLLIVITASTTANPFPTETLLELVHKSLDELSQREHELFFRTAQLIKNGLNQTCSVNEFSYSAPHCTKMTPSPTVGQICLSGV